MSEQQDEILIAVIGSVGTTGKSSFTKLLTNDASLESETSDVRVTSFQDSEIASGRKVAIADCPGFDDPSVSDLDVLKKIKDFLLPENDDKRELNGIIYLQQITDTSFVSRSRLMFRNLCGKNAYKNVVILTTSWDQLSSEEGDKREEQLKVTCKELLDGGARLMRHDLSTESARKVLEHISKLDPTTVQIQKEILLGSKTFEETTAASVCRDDVDWIIEEHNKEVKGLRNELEICQNEWKIKFDKQVEEARELRIKITASADGNDTSIIGELEKKTKELEEEKAKFQIELSGWKNEKAELTKNRDDAIEARNRMETEREDEQREWKIKFEKQEQEAGELRIKITAVAEGSDTNITDELQKKISGLEVEKVTLQTELRGLENEKAELTKNRDEAIAAQKQLETEHEDQQREWKSKFDKQEQEAGELKIKIAAAAEGNETNVRVELEKKISELEVEKVGLQTELSGWANEKIKLTKDRDEAIEARKQLEADVEGKESYIKLILELQSLLKEEKQAHADANKEHERQLQEAATINEQWRKDRYELESRLDAQRKEHAKSIEALQSQLSQEQQARADASKKYERQLQEAATINEQKRKDQEREWKSRLDTQKKEHTESMEALRSQFKQKKQTRIDSDREHKKQLREHKDREREWKNRFEAYERSAKESIAKYTIETAAIVEELEVAKKGNSTLSRELHEERAKFQIELAQWEIERVELKKGLSEAENAQEQLKDAISKLADLEKRYQDQERKWQTRFDDQEKKTREISEMLAKLEEEKKETKNELETRENGIYTLNHEPEEEEQWSILQLQWEEERMVLRRCLNEALEAQMRAEDHEKMHREKMERLIAKHDEQMARYWYEYETLRSSNEALRKMYEEEWTRSQLSLARWEAERAELKKGGVVVADAYWSAERDYLSPYSVLSRLSI